MNYFSTFQLTLAQATKLTAPNSLVISSNAVVVMMMSMYMRMRMQ